MRRHTISVAGTVDVALRRRPSDLFQVDVDARDGTLGIELEKVFTIYEEFGNIGPASVPLALAKSAEAGRIKSGDRVALMGIGSGLNCAMSELVW